MTAARGLGPNVARSQKRLKTVKQVCDVVWVVLERDRSNN
jgi:hypothetical protein